jgi:hypothetical protein
MLRVIALPVGLLALACVAPAGCGGDSSDGTSNGSEETRSANAPGAATPTAFPAGRWQGALAQRGLKPFQIRVTIRSRTDASSNTVAYSRIDCGGNWTYLGRRGPDFRFREVIDRGRGGDCKGVGIVTLRYVSDDHLRYEFRGGGVASSGFIRPEE